MRIEEAFERAKEGSLLQGALTPENLLSTLTVAVLVVGMLILIITIFIK
jgi:CHASE3 domain sensor protein